jgi:peptidoglycan/LPS O-acetylase OafA/YrhL
MFRLSTLANAARSRGDNYLPLRHAAAFLVIYGHCYALTRNPSGATDLVARLLPGFYAGSLAVYLFFAISGYLVTASLLRYPDVLRYVHNRVLRVYPGYLACLLFCVFVVGATFTTLPLSTFYGSEGTWDYLRTNLLPITLSWKLPGVFEGNPSAGVVNGTLWSLGLEVRWYFYLGLLAALTVVRRRWVFTLVALPLVLYGGWEWLQNKADVNEYRALSQTFLIAALCAHWREYIPVSHRVMAALVFCAALAYGNRWFAPIVVTGAMYFAFWVAYRLPPLRWPSGHDYSYGLFLYGFPVQQAWISLFPEISPLILLPVAIATALVLAVLSWRYVERPALYWKSDREILAPAV